MPLEGGLPRELPLPARGAGKPLAGRRRASPTCPLNQWQRAWKRYRGGQTTPSGSPTFATRRVEKVPRENSNDSNPIWVGDSVYFLSDRNGPVTLFAYDTKTKQVSELVKNDGLDLKSAARRPRRCIVYEQFGSLFLFDPAGGDARCR